MNYIFRVGALNTKKQKANPDNQYRNKWYKKPCKLIAKGAKNSVLIEFEDGERIITSFNFIQKRD